MRTGNVYICQYGEVFNTVYISKYLVSVFAQTKLYTTLVFSHFVSFLSSLLCFFGNRAWGDMLSRWAGNGSKPYSMAWVLRLPAWLCCATWTSCELWARVESWACCCLCLLCVLEPGHLTLLSLLSIVLDLTDGP